MTTEEFNKRQFSSKVVVEYKGDRFYVKAVDFEEDLIAIDEFNTGDGRDWKRCENVKYIGVESLPVVSEHGA